MRRVALILGVALAAGMLVPGGAAADDRTLRAAGQSHDADFKKLGRETLRAARAFRRARYKRGAGRLIRVHQATRTQVKVVIPAVEREQPSTPDGATYKRLLIQALREFDTGLRWDIRAVRAYSRRRLETGIRYGERALKSYALSERHEKQAVRAIKRSLG